MFGKAAFSHPAILSLQVVSRFKVMKSSVGVPTYGYHSNNISQLVEQLEFRFLSAKIKDAEGDLAFVYKLHQCIYSSYHPKSLSTRN